MKKVIAVLATTLMVAASHADEVQEAQSYDYVGVVAGIVDLDAFEGRNDVTQVTLYGSKAITDHFHVLGSYSKGEMEYREADTEMDIEADDWTFGAGFHTALNPTTSIHVRGIYASLNTTVDGDHVDNIIDDNAMSVSIGIRHNITGSLEVNGTMDTVSYDGEKTTSVVAGLVYTFLGDISATLYTGINEDDDSFLMAGVRHSF